MVQPWINANFKSFRVILVAEAARNANRCGMWPRSLQGHTMGLEGMEKEASRSIIVESETESTHIVSK